MSAGSLTVNSVSNSPSGAINLDGCRDVTIDHCEIAHVGTCGVWFRSGVSDCKLTHCYVHDTGAGAVRIADGKPTRVRFEERDGKKVRVAAKTGELING